MKPIATIRVDGPFVHVEWHRDVPNGGHFTVYAEPTLRDTFIAAALTGLCANPGGPIQANEVSGWALANCGPNDVAATVIDLADAVMKARGGV